ncbi:hypothetical protein DSO57_1033645 [Entomophthora muscae]|uniref:Uncharacterized protein n=1 Tax=Entomophthora muscae TaxID=34485 RepID=A0ACC2REU8_9FUNG|nr:hypothetical protein DSO57_1033645 [Entomophthora muscae]
MSLQHFYQDPFESIERQLFKFVNSDKDFKMLSSQSQFGTKLDVYETDKETIIHAELPGFKKEDITLDVSEEHHSLTLKGTKKRSESFDENQLRFSECSYGSFSRTIRLPPGSNFEKVSAKFDNGILEMTVPKDSAKGTRQISIV